MEECSTVPVLYDSIRTSFRPNAYKQSLAMTLQISRKRSYNGTNAIEHTIVYDKFL